MFRYTNLKIKAHAGKVEIVPESEIYIRDRKYLLWLSRSIQLSFPYCLQNQSITELIESIRARDNQLSEQPKRVMPRRTLTDSLRYGCTSTNAREARAGRKQEKKNKSDSIYLRNRVHEIKIYTREQ